MCPSPPTHPPRRSGVTPGRAAQATHGGGDGVDSSATAWDGLDGRLDAPCPQLGAPETGPPWVSWGPASVTQPSRAGRGDCKAPWSRACQVGPHLLPFN